MTRRVPAALLLAALTTFGSATPWPGLAPAARAASCTGWSSHTQPPPTIRVFRHRTGAVTTVSFKAYTKNVLSREWIGSWSTESLRSGALAVKTYAWYQVLNWRGGTNADGQCFDLRDDTWDQVYDPGQPTWSTAAAAVNATWSTVVHKNGRIFPTYYNAGAPGESCGANANGWKAFQWGTQSCGQAGLTARQIIRTYYYPGVRVTTPAPPTPTPTPTPTPSPSPTPMPTPSPTSGPTTQPTPGTTPTPRPTASPSPTPSPTPSPSPVLPTPPPSQALPGGGQEGVQDAAEPPPPPPAAPEPVVVPAAEPDAAAAAVHERPAAWEQLRRDEALRRADRLSQPPSAGIVRRAATDPRLLAFVEHWQEAIDDLTVAVARHVAEASAVARR